MPTMTGWEKAREDYKVALAAPVKFAEGSSVEVLRPDDLDFVDEGPGRFEPPVVRATAPRAASYHCQNCGGFSLVRYCDQCIASMDR